MTSWHATPATFTELEQTFVVGRPAFVASFYARQGFAAHAQAIFDAWLTVLPAKTPLVYGHESSRRLSKLTPKAIAKVRDVLSPPSVGDRYKWYFAKSAAPGSPADECHGYAFEVFATPTAAAYVYVAFPLDHVIAQGVPSVIDWFRAWNDTFAMTHAGAGFGYEIGWFDDYAKTAYPVMMPIAQRFHGVRFWHRMHARFREQTSRTLDTAAWLTYLDEESIHALADGALDRLDPGVTRHTCTRGVLLQAGAEPDACDVNRPNTEYALLRAVNDAIEPIRCTEWWIHGFAGGADVENSWFGRMAREHRGTSE